MIKGIASFLIRASVTGLAFWWIFKSVDTQTLIEAIRSANLDWLLVGIGLFFVGQFICIFRWKLLVPEHPSLTVPFLFRTFYVACFFNTFLPTTVGGDVIRGYDLIKATGQWRESLASVLMDRLIGVTGFLTFGIIAWMAFAPAREDAVIRMSFYGFCAVVLVTFAILGSRRMLNAMLKPFGKIGLGELESHAKQFQEALRAYLKQPARLGKAFSVSLLVQTLTILMFVAVSHALGLEIPALFMTLAVPIVVTLSQVPISLNGWGIREGVVVILLGRIGVGPEEALSLSLLSAAIPLLSGVVGAALFLAKRKKKKRPAAE